MGLLDSFFSAKKGGKKEPAPENLPPVAATTNPKAAEELAAKAGALMQRGIAADSKELLKEALANADRALELDPDCYNALQFRVAILVMLDKNDEDNLLSALASSDRALALQKDNAAMWFNKAGILEHLGRYEDALAAYDRSLACAPHSLAGRGGTYVARGRALEKLGRDDEALRLYGRVPADDPSYGDALEAKAALLDRDGNRDAAIAAYHNAGRVYLKRRRDTSAEGCFNHILARDPSDNEALYLKGVALLNQSSATGSAELRASALACFESALAKEPQNPGMLTGKGRCLLDMNRIGESLRLFDRALAIRPDDYEALMHKGLALMRLMRYDEALAVFDRACPAYPDDAMPWSLKAAIRVNQGNDTGALSDIDEAIRRSERDYTFWETRAAILHKLGRTAAAEEAEVTATRYRRFLRQ
jgi:tetratricopeptide (TPR) repeat protein